MTASLFRRFALLNSRLGDVAGGAFDVAFSSSFELVNVTVDGLVEGGALSQVRPLLLSSEERLFKMTSVTAGDFEAGSLLLSPELVASLLQGGESTNGSQLVFQDNRVVEKDCDCSGFKVSSLTEEHHLDKEGENFNLAAKVMCRLKEIPYNYTTTMHLLG